MTANNSKSELVKQPKKAVSSPWTQPNPNFKFGEPMLTEAALESAGPSCVTLHISTTCDFVLKRRRVV